MYRPFAQADSYSLFCSSGSTSWWEKKVKECLILLQWLGVSALSDNKICNSRKQLFFLMSQHRFSVKKMKHMG